MTDPSPATARDNSVTSLPPKVVITGGTGNLGTKLSHHLLSHDPPKYHVHLIEHPKFFRSEVVHPAAAVTLGDIADAEAGLSKDGWFAALDAADAVVHFSAVNPYPNANWSESAASMDHTFNVFHAACSRGVRRVILATSNHVMGQYKEDSPALEPGTLRPDMPPRVGTPVRDQAAPEASRFAVAYAAAKLAGERLAVSLGAFHAPRTTFVCLRIGWCQPGENAPDTLSAAGSPPENQIPTPTADKNASDIAIAGPDERRGEDEDKIDEEWFRGMWLSNRDFLAYFVSALTVDVPAEWKLGEGERDNPYRHRRRGFLLLNAMSQNSGAKWDLSETEAHLGVVSTDDSFRT